mmetsp:Transcript_26441/g.38655  ORF Transcript_26441/g.38655 Transcript_26441/m.38655 type:complete len:84 (+) Transcript_26441:110-361(+)
MAVLIIECQSSVYCLAFHTCALTFVYLDNGQNVKTSSLNEKKPYLCVCACVHRKEKVSFLMKFSLQNIKRLNEAMKPHPPSHM